MNQFLIYYERHCCLVVYCCRLCVLLRLQVCVFLPSWFLHQYLFRFNSVYLHFYSPPGAFIPKKSMHRNQLWRGAYWMPVICEPSYTAWLRLCIWMTEWCVRYDVIGNTHAGVPASWLVPWLFRGADQYVFNLLSIWKPAYLEMSSPACLTSADLITGGVMNARFLFCAAVAWARKKKGFRQVLQTVPECTETAGAAHQGSVEMTSPDKCTSDSSPAPAPPPQAPDTCSSATWSDRTGGRPRAAAVMSGRAVTLHQVGRRWGKTGGSSQCGLTHQRSFWWACALPRFNICKKDAATQHIIYDSI